MFRSGDFVDNNNNNNQVQRKSRQALALRDSQRLGDAGAQIIDPVARNLTPTAVGVNGKSQKNRLGSVSDIMNMGEKVITKDSRNAMTTRDINGGVKKNAYGAVMTVESRLKYETAGQFKRKNIENPKENIAPASHSQTRNASQIVFGDNLKMSMEQKSNKAQATHRQLPPRPQKPKMAPSNAPPKGVSIIQDGNYLNMLAQQQQEDQSSGDPINLHQRSRSFKFEDTKKAADGQFHKIGMNSSNLDEFYFRTGQGQLQLSNSRINYKKTNTISSQDHSSGLDNQKAGTNPITGHLEATQQSATSSFHATSTKGGKKQFVQRTSSLQNLMQNQMQGADAAIANQNKPYSKQYKASHIR